MATTSVYVLVPGPAGQRLPGTGVLVTGFPPLLVPGAWSDFGGLGVPSLPSLQAPWRGDVFFGLVTGFPRNLPAVPGICPGPPPTLDGTTSQAHQLAMSLNEAKGNLG